MKTQKKLGFKDKELINLPTTPEAFDALIDTLVAKYKLGNREHCEAIVAQRIMHLPIDQATTTLRYLGHCVIKNIAYQVAHARGSKIQHQFQIDELVSALTTNPNDQQARDSIEKAAGEGSEYAKAALEKLGLDPIQKPAEDTAPVVSNGPH